MISKVTLFMVIMAAVTLSDATCLKRQTTAAPLTQTTAAPLPNSNPHNNKKIVPYHPCHRPMISYLQLTYGGTSKCLGGQINNKCHGNSECLDPYHPWCCQNEYGCNECSGKIYKK